MALSSSKGTTVRTLLGSLAKVVPSLVNRDCVVSLVLWEGKELFSLRSIRALFFQIWGFVEVPVNLPPHGPCFSATRFSVNFAQIIGFYPEDQKL